MIQIIWQVLPGQPCGVIVFLGYRYTNLSLAYSSKN
jgi:hypothetical protein